jgi:hypothetical protein
MTRDEVVALFAGRQDAWDVRDAAKLAATHAEHGIVVSPMFTTVRGRAGIRGSYQSLFRIFPDWTSPPRPLVDGIAAQRSPRPTHVGEFMGPNGPPLRVGVPLFRSGRPHRRERRFFDFTWSLSDWHLRTKPAKTG